MNFVVFLVVLLPVLIFEQVVKNILRYTIVKVNNNEGWYDNFDFYESKY